ncbi:hypothetical protein K456DRAFT_1151827 [Colletotrichum gloeosporioides 23]|nr:hypothetical protein K456DRAFT_1151827 [Colletotrichum gloeosporioides 23]
MSAVSNALLAKWYSASLVMRRSGVRFTHEAKQPPTSPSGDSFCIFSLSSSSLFFASPSSISKCTTLSLHRVMRSGARFRTMPPRSSPVLRLRAEASPPVNLLSHPQPTSSPPAQDTSQSPKPRSSKRRLTRDSRRIVSAPPVYTPTTRN